MFHIHPLTYEDALWVAKEMRGEDHREISAVRGRTLFAERVALDCHLALGYGGVGYVAYWGEIPVAAIGAIPLRPGVWSVYMFATGYLSKVGLGLTRWAKNTFHPELKALGAHRIQCESIEGHDDAHAWMETFGAKNEGPLPKFGIGQETFYRFAWTGD